VNGDGRVSGRFRREIAGWGLRASIAADVNAVVSSGGGPSSSTERGRVHQNRSIRNEDEASEGKEEIVSEQPGLGPDEPAAQSDDAAAGANADHVAGLAQAN